MQYFFSGWQFLFLLDIFNIDRPDIKKFKMIFSGIPVVSLLNYLRHLLLIIILGKRISPVAPI